MSEKPTMNRPPLGNWFLMLLFPPYGFYYFLFRSRLKWFIKVPISLILVLFFVLALDQTLHPHRVEVAQVEETITNYIGTNSELRMGTLQRVERKGTFVWDEEAQLVYRTLTTTGLYDVIVKPNEENTFEVSGIFQTYPVIAWVTKESEEKYPTAPMAMLYFYEQSETLGEIKRVKADDGKNILETDKGVFRFTFEKNKVVSIEKEDGEIVLQQKNEYDMPEKAVIYFKKNKEELGELTEVYAYDMDSGKEMYFVKTTTGIYRVDDFNNGNMELFRQEAD